MQTLCAHPLQLQEGREGYPEEGGRGGHWAASPTAVRNVIQLPHAILPIHPAYACSISYALLWMNFRLYARRHLRRIIKRLTYYSLLNHQADAPCQHKIG